MSYHVTPITTSRVKKEHPKFFFDNTLVVLEIEDTLFNVHKYQLMKSETFSDMFQAANRDPEEGSCREKPIILQGISALDFECLLTVLYATRFSTYQPAPEASLIIPAFRLANLWNFSDLRVYLLPLAEKELSDVDKIVFAREFDIKEWLAPAHTRLCEREQPPTTDEALKLGVHSLLLITRVREESRKAITSCTTPTCGPCAGLHVYSNGDYLTCAKCGSRTRVVQARSASSADTPIGVKVQKWVDEGCVLSS
ncbi:The BTB (BR-C, ttk and bab)/POZ (Pox virus and Zinc finger) domain [Ceratobasidium sp. AG-Ba]|nr:The BTB (BR-C, ttk and bab)/POZ (Pox virus and Zinc finger) domain [Ceratobasidium sp. AG-Ba]QRW07300.1 The BTB (BR-C, ttk and bab)/POZ (Pox virus and Zinc finger) domain [Ceratobasidium sp. AG-Ba]